MAIEYVRTMKIRYGEKLDENTFAKLSGALADKGLYMTDMWSNVDVDNGYGYQTVEEQTKVYQIIIDDNEIFSVDYVNDAKIICAGLEDIHPSIKYSTVRTTTESKQWIEPEGNRIAVALEDIVGNVQNFSNWGENDMTYGDDLSMVIWLHNSYAGLSLEFRMTWTSETVQRKEAIEENMVQIPLKDMGLIQKVVESRLKLKKFGFDTEDVVIDCHFDAKTESRSECTPDIIKQVREARRGNE